MNDVLVNIVGATVAGLGWARSHMLGMPGNSNYENKLKKGSLTRSKVMQLKPNGTMRPAPL